MKNTMALIRFGRTLSALLAAVLAPGWGGWGLALADATDISSAPIFTSATATTEVKPNLMFVLDDSGSMSWSYMPDNANNFFNNYGYASSQCNGVYYNPGLSYTPPVDSSGASYPAASFTAAQYDGYNAAAGALSTSTGKGTVDLNSGFQADMYVPYAANTTYGGLNDPAKGAYYYVYSGTQTTAKLKDYYTTGSTFYKECNSTFGSTPGSGVFNKRRLSSTETTTITVSGTGGSSSSSASLTGITVNGVQIMSAASATTSSISSSTMATNIKNRITLGGFSATASGSTVTITGPTSAANNMPVISTSGSMGTITLTTDVFPDTTAANLANFANWYSYYRTRMLMMKTASGQAFGALGNHFRVGFMSIDNNASPAFLNISDFDSTQKSDWYNKLYGSTAGNSTPLREALANAGRMYAGKMTSIYGATVTNPVQYACQQNYTILSTDGFWNGTDSNVKKLNGTTTMDNQDGPLPRPYNDGMTTTYNKTTSQLQNSQTKLIQNTSQLQQRTTQIQSDTTQVQIRTVRNQTSTTQLQQRTVQVQKRTQQFQKCRPDGSSCQNINFDCTSGGTGDGTRSLCKPGTPSAWSNINSCTPTNGNPVTLCQTLTDTGWMNAASCTPSNPAAGPTVTCQSTPAVLANVGTCTPSSSGGQTVTCLVASDSGFVNTASCSPSNPAAGPTVTCQVADPGWVNAASCTPSGPTAGKTITCQTTDTGGVGAGSCSASSSGGKTVTCQTVAPGPTPVASCSCAAGAGSSCTTAASSGNSWTQTTCNNSITSAAVGVASCAADPATAANSFISTNCNTVTTGPTSTSTCTAAAASSSNNYTATTCSIASTAGGTSDTLADVAAYYYNTNLRTSSTLGNCAGPIIAPATTASDLCIPNKVPANGLDTATWQHMTTFTLGLGARGRMVFSSTYLTDPSGDYFDVSKGNTAGATNCAWQSASGTPCNWPTPGSDQIENIDDLWHAAVNGHGNYFSATDPATLTSALSSSLNVIINTPQPGTAASAATTNPKITSNNNFQFSSYFKSVEWSGELIRQTMSLADGSVPLYDHMHPNPAAYDWSAQTLLDAKGYAARTIYTKGAAGLIPFTWTALGTAGLQSNFTTPNISTTPPPFPTLLTGLHQFCAAGPDCISATAQTSNTIATGGAAGEALVNFLRGDRSNEEGTVTDPTKYFRHRAHVLGDIVSAQPQYVGAPGKSYTDINYDAFTSLKGSRTPVVYAAANDGMLHAFDAAAGNEKWAYIPSFMVPRLYTLADKKYSDKHQYFVEGTPLSGDICPNAPSSTCTASQWKTILVGGLNGGGTGYYALDVTDAENPALLWEFTDANMGYTFGKPQITKLDNGTWVVLLTSGYNNCPHAATTAQQNCVENATGDGLGHLYVLNAATGVQISSTPISTGIGGISAPSGLAQIIAQAGSDNITRRVYGGDLLGNLWRFTIGSAGYGKQLLATFLDQSGNAQPITSRPQVTTFNGKPVVYVGTGRYLGTADVGGTLQQSFYAVKDNLGSTTYGSLRADTTFISKTAVESTCPAGTDVNVCQPGTKVRIVVQNTGAASDSLTSKNGWFVDFPANSGELSFTDPKLVHGTLAFSTSVPTATTSAVCGSPTSADPVAFGYMLDFLTGGAVGTTSGVIANTLGTGVATTVQIAQLPDGTVIGKYRLSSGQEVPSILRFPGSANPTKRVSWRELTNDQ